MRRKLPSIVFYVLFVAFVYWYVRRLDFSTLEGVSFDPWMLSVATALALLFRYWSVFTWLDILKGLGVGRIQDKVTMAYVYAKSWLGRYLPGKVTWIFGKIYFASEQGIPRRKLAVGSVVEAALQTTVTLLLSLVLLSFDARLDVFTAGQKVVMFVGSATLVITLLPPVFNRLVGLAYVRLRKGVLQTEDHIKKRTLLRGLLLYGLGFFASGASYFFLTKSLHPELPYEHLFFIVGAFNLAGAIGIVSVFAPSGIGVRESVQLLLLPLVISAELALIVTVAARLWSLLVDGLFFVITWLHRGVSLRFAGESSHRKQEGT